MQPNMVCLAVNSHHMPATAGETEGKGPEENVYKQSSTDLHSSDPKYSFKTLISDPIVALFQPKCAAHLLEEEI